MRPPVPESSEIEHISPLARKHIHLHGHYPFNLAARPERHRLLRTPAGDVLKAAPETPNRVYANRTKSHRY